MGVDLVELERIGGLVGQHPLRFLERCFRPGDLARNGIAEPGSVATLAGSWAAKEAFLKALGADLQRIPYRDIELVLDTSGGLTLKLYGRADEAGQRMGVGSIRVDITRSPAAALAMVVLES